MQFIERNSYNIRAAVYELKHPHDTLEFVLFPMIHVGAFDYYRQVRQLLEKCDRILFEGVRGLRARLLTLTYRFMVRRKRLKLVTQNELRLRDLGERLIHADVDAATFENAWSNVPVWVRIILACAVPLYSLYLFAFATRKSIAQGLELDDLPTREETLNSSDKSEMVEHVLLHSRDAHLVEVIGDIHSKTRHEPLRVAILYGAAHMRAVSRYLIGTLGYRVVRGNWVTVFEL